MAVYFLNIHEFEALKDGCTRLLDAFRPMENFSCSGIPDWLMSGAPGALTDVTVKLRDWLNDNVRRFREAHPEGGEFHFSAVEICRRDNSETNSEDYDSTYVDSFRLDEKGVYSFHTFDVNEYYDAELDEHIDVSLDSILSIINMSDDFKNFYRVFKKVLESADRDFKCEGTFAHLSSGKYLKDFPDHSVVEIKNVLPLDVLLPSRSDFDAVLGMTSLVELYSPNGNNLGREKVLGLRYGEEEPEGIPLDVWDRRGLLGLQGAEGLEVSSSDILERINELVFNRKNLESLAPCYIQKGLPVPSDPRVSMKDDLRRKKTKATYTRFSSISKGNSYNKKLK